jgi:hypothetical protein
VIRADLDLLPGSADDPDATAPAPPSPGVRARRSASNPLGQQPFPPLAAAPVPSWARASGRAGQGELLFAAGAALALLDAALRADPPAAGRRHVVKAGFTPDALSWPTPPPPPSSRDVASALVPATSGIKPVELAQSAFNFDWLNKLFNSQPSQVAYWP